MAPLAERAASTRPPIGVPRTRICRGRKPSPSLPPPLRPRLAQREGKPLDGQGAAEVEGVGGGVTLSLRFFRPEPERLSQPFPGQSRHGSRGRAGGGGRQAGGLGREGSPHLRQDLGPESRGRKEVASWLRSPAGDGRGEPRPARRRAARPSAGKEAGAPQRDEGGRGLRGSFLQAARGGGRPPQSSLPLYPPPRSCRPRRLRGDPAAATPVGPAAPRKGPGRGRRVAAEGGGGGLPTAPLPLVPHCPPS